MLDGLYRIDGDLNFMMNLERIFGSNDKDKQNEQFSKNNKILGIGG